MRNRRNYYRVLHVQRDAPPAVIKASYRAIMQRMTVHPDLGGDHAQAVLINEAFHTLSDPARRAAYDRANPSAPSQGRGHSQPAPAPIPAAGPRSAATPGATPACAFCRAAIGAIDATRSDAVCPACGSALCSAHHYRDDSGSRRAVERLPRHLRMTFRVATARETTWNGTIEDMSLNGMRFVSPVALELGARVRIECDFCSAVAVVKAMQPAPAHGGRARRCGVEFLTLLVKRQRGGLISTVA